MAVNQKPDIIAIATRERERERERCSKVEQEDASIESSKQIRSNIGSVKIYM
jgi:hypothetical protein